MKVTLNEIEKYVGALEETPRSIARRTKNMDSARLHNKLEKKSWSVNDVLAHLRSCADVWGNSIDAMLAENIPTLPDLHPRQWIKETNYPELPFHESFQAFAEQREKLLVTLKNLSFNDWSRAALIGGRKHTVFTQTRRLAKHEQEHCEQIATLLADTSRQSNK